MLQEPTADFNFDGLKLGPPNGLQGGSYFAKLLNNEEPLYLQIPKCLTKQGLVVTEKKKYCDLMFSRDASDVISWFENIERVVQGLLYEKKNIWFHEDLELSDIENAFTSPIRSYRSGQYYLVRCTVPKVISPETITCYNENEEPISLDIMNEQGTNIIPLVEIQGVRFSSKNFQIEIGLRQVMAIKKKQLFKNCLIRLEKTQLEVEQAEAVEQTVEQDAQTVEQAQAVEQQQGQTLQKNPVEDVSAIDQEVQNETEDLQSVDEQIKEFTQPETIEQQTDEPVHLEVNEVEEIIKEPSPFGLEEISIDTIEENDPLILKKPSDVYYEMWRSARQKARMARKEALAAYLEAKKIKENYMLDGIDSESDDDVEFEQVLE